MTKNEDMFKKGVCPKGWAIKEQSAVLDLSYNALHCIDRSALHLTALLTNRPRSSFRIDSYNA
jgi:hypothetical protein